MANESVTKPLPWFLYRQADPEMKFSLPADWERTERQSRKDQSLPVRLHFRRLTGTPNWVGFPQIQSLRARQARHPRLARWISRFCPSLLSSWVGQWFWNRVAQYWLKQMWYWYELHIPSHISVRILCLAVIYILCIPLSWRGKVTSSVPCNTTTNSLLGPLLWVCPYYPETDVEPFRPKVGHAKRGTSASSSPLIYAGRWQHLVENS